ncbi:MAG: glycosyl transferase family 1 [Gemmatimonadetes bacterium]|nr:glycosyl transferase family 1 [Gemmatimonadota bacterium]
MGRGRMRPFTIVAGDFVTTGGMDAANYALADFLRRQSREVHVVAHRIAASLAGGVTVHRVHRPLGSHMLGAPLLAREGRYWAGVMRRRGGVSVVNGGNCVGQVNWLHYVHAVHAPLGTRGIRRVLGAMLHQRDRDDEARAARAATLVIANSERTRADAIERLGVAPERVHRVYYGTDASRFRIPSATERASARARLGISGSEPVMIFIGALGDRRKGFDTLYSAWQSLQREGWRGTLLVAGAGAELDSWRARAAAAGLGRSIQFLGFRQDIRELLAASDAIVAPSRYEAYGLAVQEALCCGIPAIVSAQSGIAERGAGAGMLRLQSAEDANELLVRILEWSSSREAHAAGAREIGATLAQWSWDAMSRQIVELAEAHVS